MSKKTTRKKYNRSTRDFLLPDPQSSEDGTPIQTIAKVEIFKSIQNIICICQKTGEVLSCSIRGKMRSKKGSTKKSSNHIEAGMYVLVSRRGFGTIKYTHEGSTINIAKADIVQKYSDSQWNEIKFNSDFVNQQVSKTKDNDETMFDFDDSVEFDENGNFEIDDI